MEKGKVMKSTGSWYQVRLEDGHHIESRIAGKFRIEDKKVTNPIAVGDEVLVERELTTNKGVIKEVLERKNFVARQSPHKRHNMHILASNLDQAVLIVTIVEPNLKQGFIDRFLLTTEPYNIPTCIVFNKADLYDDDDLAYFLEMRDLYKKIGYQVLLVSAATGDGVDDLAALLKDKITLIGGQSGVGKSSLVNTIQPELDLRTGEISNYSGKGQHTTTFAEMHLLSFGGAIIDTPGIKSLSFNYLKIMDVAHNFREFFIYSENCKYPNCTHRQEPGCAVKAALETGEINEMRYDNYIVILEEVAQQNDWELN
ncbi:MAG: ribosome small subunit-dependent GTPase A [Saprospiraceae bacterium]|nr:ribosome small subunit-dependent GTPase A [Saprospiraceae bacterium]